MRETAVMEAPPKFDVRDSCISCRSSALAELSGGDFDSDPLRTLIESDPWGENPLPALRGERWSLVRCSDCGQKFHGRILSPHWNEVRFSRWMSEEAIRQFESTHGGGENQGAAYVQHALRLKDLGVGRILDFGCGFGHFLEMCRLFGLDAVGVDRSSARRAGAEVSIYAALDDVPGTFDAITMFEVLEHLDDPLGALAKLRGRLNSGGYMIVEVPDTSGVTSIIDRESYYKIHPLDHINAFTPDSLELIMARAGFSPIKKEAAFVTTSLKRVMKDVAKARLRRPTTQSYFQLR